MPKQLKLEELEKDTVTKYLERILEGLVRNSEVSAGKKEFPNTNVVYYIFDVTAKEDRPYFEKSAIFSALDIIIDRAAYKYNPKYNEEDWDVVLKRLWVDPI